MPRISISDSSTFFRLLSLAENCSKKVSELLKRLLCGHRNRKFCNKKQPRIQTCQQAPYLGIGQNESAVRKIKFAGLLMFARAALTPISYSTTWPQATKACLKRTKVVFMFQNALNKTTRKQFYLKSQSEEILLPPECLSVLCKPSLVTTSTLQRNKETSFRTLFSCIKQVAVRTNLP